MTAQDEPRPTSGTSGTHTYEENRGPENRVVDRGLHETAVDAPSADPCDRCGAERGPEWLCRACGEPPAVLRDEGRWRTCLHEAAHAVVGIVVGQPPDVVSVKPGHTFRGITILAPSTYEPTLDGEPRVFWDPMLPLKMRDQFEASIVLLLAGSLGGDLALLNGYAPPEAVADEEAATLAVQSLVGLHTRQRERLQELAADKTRMSDEQQARETMDLLVQHDKQVGAFLYAYLEAVTASWVRSLAPVIRGVAFQLWRCETTTGEWIAEQYPRLVQVRPA